MGDTVTVDVKPAWASKINLGELIKAGAVIAAAKGLDIPVEVQNDIFLVIECRGAIYIWVGDAESLAVLRLAPAGSSAAIFSSRSQARSEEPLPQTFCRPRATS